MNGLELSKSYYLHIGKPMLEAHFPGEVSSMAIGLVGQGSECLGFDDAISQDHDFGPGFCIWLPENRYRIIGPKLQAAYDAMPTAYGGFDGRRISAQADQRVGVFSIESFYSRYINSVSVPVDALHWFKIPMHYLRTVTNGAVFTDPLGTFTAIREGLLAYYPEDVVRKKLAAKVAVMAQSGQYNYPRAVRRRDLGSAYLASAAFVEATLAVVFLLNRSYMPFYKWAFRAAQDLPAHGAVVRELLALLSFTDDATGGAEKARRIEHICVQIGQALVAQGLSTAQDAFLQVHADALMQGISDMRLRTLPVMLDFD